MSSGKIKGPTLPPGYGGNDSSDDSDTYGPALPPSMTGSQGSSESSSKFKQTVESVDDEDEDNIVGPLPSDQFDKNHPSNEIEFFSKKPEKSAREEWMLVPSKSLSQKLPTKSVTHFSRGNKPKPLTDEDRLEIQSNIKKDEKMEVFLENYSKNNKRSLTLMEQHQLDKKKPKKEKPVVEKVERKEFDRERDLRVPKMNAKHRSAFIKETSSSFGDKWSSGRFQKFL